jgi:hypothetical protein
MAIERLTLKNAVTAATFFAGNLNGQDYRYAASALLTYIQSNLSLPGIFTTQYSSPSATAFSVTITDGSSDNTNVHLILTPTGAFAAGRS